VADAALPAPLRRLLAELARRDRALQA
jgi:hypothetical protein